MSIKIPVSADFDQQSIDAQLQSFRQKLNALGQQIAQANKTQFNPVSKTTVDDLKKVTQQFEALKRVSGDLNKRVNATGQKGAGFFDLDWSQLYPDHASRARQMAKSFQYVTGHAFVPPPNAAHPNKHKGGGHGFGQTAAHVAQHAIHATEPITGAFGNVASKSIGTGMAAGAGAGLMGLIGGIVGVGVHKIMEAAAEELGNVEKEYVAFDKLKRSLGDVNVSFDALKTTLKSAADNVKITYSEAGQLGAQFAKLGNVTSAQVTTIKEEIETGVGFAKAFGLENSESMGFFGQMRGVGATKDENGTKRMALLIGETIGKSDAFAKTGEVMQAIAGYTTNQTRNSLGNANVEGFAGMFSAMVGSKIPGLDPAGAGALLSRVNSTLAAGGGHGEASQFFTAKLGAKRGMDVFDTQLWREGGAFSTADGTFSGKGAVAEFYKKHGLKGPSGNETLLSSTLAQIKQEYGNDPKMMLKAMSNQLGISMSQAAAFDDISPNQMGDMLKYAPDLTKLSASGIGNMSKSLYGTDADRLGIKNTMMGRSDVSDKDKKALEEAFKSGNAESQKEILAKLSASYDQERTTGTDIRDSKNALENIKANLAGKIVDEMTIMRMGIVHLAGKGEMTKDEFVREIQKKEYDRTVGQIDGEFDPGIVDAEKKIAKLKGEKSRAMNAPMPRFGEAGAAAKADRDAKLKEFDTQIKAAEDEKRQLLDAKRAKLKAAGVKLESLPQSVIDEFNADAAAAGVPPEVAEAGLSIYAQESGGGKNTKTTNHGAMGHMQMKQSTFDAYADKGWNIHNPSHNRQAALRYLNDMYKKSGGNIRTAIGAFYGGEKAIGKDGKLKTFNDLKNPNAPDTQGYADEVMGRMRNQGTPMPVDAQTSRGSDPLRIKFDPLDLNIRNERGQSTGQSYKMTGRISNGGRASPFGQGVPA